VTFGVSAEEHAHHLGIAGCFLTSGGIRLATPCLTGCLDKAELLSIESSDDFLEKAAVKWFATLPRHPSYAHEREMQWDFASFCNLVCFIR
jgi:hypothetical protein